MVVKEFVTSVLQTLPEPGEGGVGGHAREAAEGSAAAAGSEASEPKVPPKGRAAMGLDDDTDEEEVAATNVEARASTMPAAKKRKVYAVVRQEMRTISIAGMELRVKPRWKCHGIAVPLEGDYLLKILKHLRKRLYEGEVPEPDATKSERRKANLERRDDEDAGRIRWDFPTHSYQVFYADAEGKQHKVAKPFKVPRTDALGNVFDNKTFTAARVAALHKARAFWNKHDKSSSGRYEQANETDTD